MVHSHELHRLEDDGGRTELEPPTVSGSDRTALGPLAEWDDTADRYKGKEDAIRSLISRGIQIESSGLNTLSSRQLWQLVHDIGGNEDRVLLDQLHCPFPWNSFEPKGWGSAEL